MAKAQKGKISKSNYMSDEAFADLKGAVEDALAYERGGRKDLRVTRVAVPRPPKPISSGEIARVRQRLNCSRRYETIQAANSWLESILHGPHCYPGRKK